MWITEGETAAHGSRAGSREQWAGRGTPDPTSLQQEGTEWLAEMGCDFQGHLGHWRHGKSKGVACFLDSALAMLVR